MRPKLPKKDKRVAVKVSIKPAIRSKLNRDAKRKEVAPSTLASTIIEDHYK